MKKRKGSVDRVRNILETLALPTEVVELSDSTRTAAEAAEAVGCRVGQIAKSIVFRGSITGRPVVVVASGSNRVDEAKVGALLGEKIAIADADFVREATGFVIGGVSPVGLPDTAAVFVDRDLTQYQDIWAAAGTPRAVFRLTPPDLIKMTNGTVGEVS